MERDLQWWMPSYVHDPLTDSTKREGPHAAIWKIAMNLHKSQGAERRGMADAQLQLYYGNSRATNSGFRGLTDESRTAADPPSVNVVSYCVDALTNRVGRNKVRPLFVTEQGDAELQAKAKAMQLAVEGEFQSKGIYGRLGRAVRKDGLILEAGAAKAVPDYANMRMIVERVDPTEVYFVEAEARLGDPRQMYHIMRMDRGVLLSMFSDDSPASERARELIKAAPPLTHDMAAEWGYTDMLDEGEAADMVMVVEATHKPSGRVDRDDPKAWGFNEDGEFDPELETGHDGRRALVIESGTLLDEPWPFDYFNVHLFLYNRRARGPWSCGVPELLAGEQLALHRMNTRIDGVYNLHARPIVYLYKGAKINPSKLTNSWATIIEGQVPASQAIHHIVPQSMPGEYISRVDKIVEWSEKKVGLNELSIQGERPPGVYHAPGMQMMDEEQSVRLSDVHDAWAEFHVSLAKGLVDGFKMLSRYAKRHGKKFELLFADSKTLKRIPWDEIDLEESRWHLTTWPTNLLPQTPGAKISRLFDLVNLGVFSVEEVATVLDFPDLRAVRGDATANRENIERRIERLVNGKANESDLAPSPWMDLQLAQNMAREKINRMEADGDEDARIEPLREFFQFVTDELTQLQQQQAAMQQAQAQPPAPAAAPPAQAPQGV